MGEQIFMRVDEVAKAYEGKRTHDGRVVKFTRVRDAAFRNIVTQ